MSITAEASVTPAAAINASEGAGSSWNQLTSASPLLE
ncbi:MAG: hypothetical protein FD152_4349 [Xanthobacteraceae bacterium]|nr:MAG: hypothetical protein FD152_4349 [Xanthobacteraceae bacterium]